MFLSRVSQIFGERKHGPPPPETLGGPSPSLRPWTEVFKHSGERDPLPLEEPGAAPPPSIRGRRRRLLMIGAPPPPRPYNLSAHRPCHAGMLNFYCIFHVLHDFAINCCLSANK